MNSASVLIVDDEKNIRLTLSMALEQLGISADTASTGTEALKKLAEKFYEVILLDLRLPDLNGMEILRHIAEQRPEIKVIVITAYGSIDLAVEAMKLGAVDFLAKPFDTGAVREMVQRVSDQESLEKRRGQDYEHYLELAKQQINNGQFPAARVYAQKAIFLNANRPEAFNLLGGLLEARCKRKEADTNYRIALELDPNYEPAKQNLKRVTSRPYTQLGIVWDYPVEKRPKAKT
jgi:FixJ family two-component response regulator